MQQEKEIMKQRVSERDSVPKYYYYYCY